MSLNVCVVYNFPVPSCGPEHIGLAERFVQSYRQYPPLHDHQMLVISNGGTPDGKAIAQFSWIENTQFISRTNEGRDIGGYQLAARSVACDLMVFFGGSSYIRGPGWLKRMVEVFSIYGDALYGCTGNQGDSRFSVWPHVRTTGFWCRPGLINEHPYRVHDNGMRYPYEHGPEGLTSWVLGTKRKCWIVGWDDIRIVQECDRIVGGYHNNSQHNILVGDRLTSPPYHHCA